MRGAGGAFAASKKANPHKRPPLRRLHSSVGIVAFIFVITGAGSGVIHTAMVYVSPAPPPAIAPTPPRVSAATQELVLTENTTRIQVCTWPSEDSSSLNVPGGITTYQIQHLGADVPVYRDATTGVEISDGDRIYAQKLAEAFVQGPSEHLTHKTAFDGEYVFINKYLPVHHFAATNDDTQVFISTRTGSVTRSNSAWDRAQVVIFRNFHSWTFLPEPVRTIWIIFLGSAATITCFLGLWLMLPFRRR